MPHNDHTDNIDVNTEGRRDRRNDAQSVVGLIFGRLAVVVRHDCCRSFDCFFPRGQATLVRLEKMEQRINTVNCRLQN